MINNTLKQLQLEHLERMGMIKLPPKGTIAEQYTNLMNKNKEPDPWTKAHISVYQKYYEQIEKEHKRKMQLEEEKKQKQIDHEIEKEIDRQIHEQIEKALDGLFSDLKP